MVASASGIPARIRSRTATVIGDFTPPGTIHEGCTRSSAKSFDHLQAELAQLDAGTRQLGLARSAPTTLRMAGSASMPSSRSGAER